MCPWKMYDSHVICRSYRRNNKRLFINVRGDFLIDMYDKVFVKGYRKKYQRRLNLMHVCRQVQVESQVTVVVRQVQVESMKASYVSKPIQYKISF